MRAARTCDWDPRHTHTRTHTQVALHMRATRTCDTDSHTPTHASCLAHACDEFIFWFRFCFLCLMKCIHSLPAHLHPVPSWRIIITILLHTDGLSVLFVGGDHFSRTRPSRLHHKFQQHQHVAVSYMHEGSSKYDHKFKFTTWDSKYIVNIMTS